MKTIFITGTSSGLGKAAVNLFHSKGWKVIATMRNTYKATDFEGMKRVTVLPLDITDTQQINTTVESVIALGNIDVVLNNAAYGAIGALESVTEDDIRKIVDTNLLGAIRVTKAFIPHFRTNKSGLFINITSMAGFLTFPFDSLYHAVKFGLEGWSEGMSYELEPFGIGIKTVAPGFIKSAFGANMAITSAEPYQQLMDTYLKAVTNPEMMKDGSTPETIAESVYEAATDGKNQVHYIAGNDAKALYERRLEIGAEAYREEITSLFLH
jgi:NAD(P)-dependent dehydrogenase (short-subunit alcohol dehydrogenase family)